MCISAPASIAAGTLLSAVGIWTIRQNKQKSYTMFAAIPLIFALQQFSEALVWLSFDHPAYALKRIPAIRSFLFLAEVVWPIYVPLSVLRGEIQKNRKRILLFLTAIGACFSAWLLWGIAFFEVSAEISDSHILYNMHYPNSLALAGSIAYFSSTVISLFVSSMNRIRLLAYAILASFLISKLYFSDTLISVWCFFAAIASVIVYYIVKEPAPVVQIKEESL